MDDRDLGPNYEITLVIDRKEAGEFILAFEDEIAKMSKEQVYEAYIYIQKRNAIAISFDKNWEPFLGYTRSRNPTELRTPLKRGGYVIRKIRKMTKTKSHMSIYSGGRVFITKQGAFRIDENLIQYELCKWIWLGDDPVEEILRLLMNAKSRFE